MSEKFANKVVLVTGAASGMGRGTALAFAREGASVVIADVNTDGLEQTAAETAQQGGECFAVPFDAMSEASCIALVRSAVDKYGKLDVLCNIAGIAGFWRLDEVTREILDRYMTINATSVLSICREAIPHLKRTKGCIINTASIAARTSAAMHSPYCMSKAAVLMLTKCLALEFFKDGIRVNAICPGYFDTNMNATLRIPEGFDLELAAARGSLPGVIGLPEDYAGVAMFLASPEARYINGADIFVDGGSDSSI